ncbi:MAG: hypothetical protein RLZZ440_1632 [Planctomycetota bacterium]|jgi:tRNA threonylcarbamoyl adenosine modification protein YjeE
MHSTPPAADPPAETVIDVADESALAPLAARLVAALPRRMLLAVTGDLGAGKTTFIKAVAAACGLDPAEVISPTFGLIHEYLLPERPGLPERLIHADLYRLTGSDELAETGWEDATAGDCWVFLEWPERIAAALPAERIDLAIEIVGRSARRFHFRGRGTAATAAVRAVVSDA